MLLVAVLAAFALAGCGGSSASSKQTQAHAAICASKANIEKTIRSLSSLTVSLSSVSKLESDLSSVKSDLTTIRDHASHLSGTRRQAVTEAVDTFKSSLDTTVSGLTSHLSLGSLSSAGSQVRAAVSKLKVDFSHATKPFDCS